MKFKLWLLVLLLSGLSSCTLYKVTSTEPSGKQIKLLVLSPRKFDAPDLHYERTATEAVFDFQAAKVTDSNAELMHAIMNGRLIVAPGPPRSPDNQ